MVMITFCLNPRLVIFAIACALTACGGGRTTNLSVPEVIPPAVVEPDFSNVTSEVMRHPIPNMGLLIGNQNGVLLSLEKGDFSVNDSIRLASSSKFLTGLSVWSLIEEGALTEADKPSELIAGWPQNRGGTDITLNHLMSFTSGYNLGPRDSTCAGRSTRTLESCVLEIVVDETDSDAGELFAYGPEHMQVAALLARSVTSEELFETLRRNILDPVGASSLTGFFSGTNTRYSGNAQATTVDYGLILQGVLSGGLVTDLDGFLSDRTKDADIFFRPTEFERAGRDWHYGFGFWLECDVVPFDESCNVNPTISSAGARGFVPWIDFDHGYWAIISMDVIGEASRSSELQQILQPMIEAALAP